MSADLAPNLKSPQSFALTQYTVDAFTKKVFAGNPAAICILDEWLPDHLMHKIALENNLSETAFAIRINPDDLGSKLSEPLSEGSVCYHLRWFTPGGEIDLCGHATLATSFVIFNYIHKDAKEIAYKTRSGVLRVKREPTNTNESAVSSESDLIVMDFPSFELKEIPVTDEIIKALGGVVPSKAYMGGDIVCVLDDVEQVVKVKVDQEAALQLDGHLLHVTTQGSKGSVFDCISRSFGPKSKIAEDPVCGRGHCHFVPLWSKILNQQDITAYQASARGGELYCTFNGPRTILRGHAVLFSKGTIYFNLQD